MWKRSIKKSESLLTSARGQKIQYLEQLDHCLMKLPEKKLLANPLGAGAEYGVVDTGANMGVD